MELGTTVNQKQSKAVERKERKKACSVQKVDDGRRKAFAAAAPEGNKIRYGIKKPLPIGKSPV